MPNPIRHGTPRDLVVATPTPKPLWKSRTLWFNLVVAGLATAEAAAGLLQPLLPGNAYGWLVFALTVGNAMLRVVTTVGVTLGAAAATATGTATTTPTEAKP